jgi:predicted ester cyclase
VVTRFTATGTHKAELFGMPATGKKATVTGITITRYDSNGKSAEVWSNFDQLGMLQQLGLAPMPAPSKN